jgi:hypothetical protein
MANQLEAQSLQRTSGGGDWESALLRFRSYLYDGAKKTLRS